MARTSLRTLRMASSISRCHSSGSLNQLLLRSPSTETLSGLFGIVSSSRTTPHWKTSSITSRRSTTSKLRWSAKVLACSGALLSARRRLAICLYLVLYRNIDDIRLQSEERLPMKFSHLVEHVSKKPIPPHVKHLIVEIMASDADDEDVEVPFIVVRI